MNSQYDVYLCREYQKEKQDFMARRTLQIQDLVLLKVIKESDLPSMLEYAWLDFLKRKLDYKKGA